MSGVVAALRARVVRVTMAIFGVQYVFLQDDSAGQWSGATARSSREQLRTAGAPVRLAAAHSMWFAQREAAVGFFSYDPRDRWALLSCDVCDRVLVPDGGMSTKTLRESFPEDTAPHFRDRNELRVLAARRGWRAGADRGSWTCPECDRNQS